MARFANSILMKANLHYFAHTFLCFIQWKQFQTRAGNLKLLMGPILRIIIHLCRRNYHEYFLRISYEIVAFMTHPLLQYNSIDAGYSSAIIS